VCMRDKIPGKEKLAGNKMGGEEEKCKEREVRKACAKRRTCALRQRQRSSGDIKKGKHRRGGPATWREEAFHMGQEQAKGTTRTKGKREKGYPSRRERDEEAREKQEVIRAWSSLKKSSYTRERSRDANKNGGIRREVKSVDMEGQKRQTPKMRYRGSIKKNCNS